MGVQLTLAQWSGRSLPTLLALLLVALTTSIAAVGVLTAVLIVATLLSLLHGRPRAGASTALVTPMLAFALITLVSAAAAANPTSALWKSRSLLSLGLFFVTVVGFRRVAQVRGTLSWFFGAVGLVSLYAILQTAACVTTLELPGWVGWALRVNLDACRVAHPFRAKGFFSIYMTLAGSLLIALSLLFGTLSVGFRRGQAWLVGPATLALVALGLTHVRSAWVGFAVAVVLLVVLTRRLALLLPIVLAMLVALTVSPALTARLLSMLDPSDVTARDRLDFWDAGIRMVKAAPLLGFGPGGVREHYPEFRRPEARKPRTGHLHNNFVQIAAERGLLGLLAWLWLWVTFFFRASRIYRNLPRARAEDRAVVAASLAAVAGFLVAGLFEYNFGDAEVIDLLWVVMAFPFVVARDAPVEVPVTGCRTGSG